MSEPRLPSRESGANAPRGGSTAAPAITQAYYFGCLRGVGWHREAGHYLHDERLSGSMVRVQRDRGWGYGCGPFEKIDGGLAPRPAGRNSEAPQGQAALHHKDGWTALAFWDRSGDSRGNSNSAFFFDAILTFDEALAEARARFPALFERFPFEVVEWR